MCKTLNEVILGIGRCYSYITNLTKEGLVMHNGDPFRMKNTKSTVDPWLSDPVCTF